jgi:hypothetical protein
LSDVAISKNTFSQWHLFGIFLKHVDIVLSKISDNTVVNSKYGIFVTGEDSSDRFFASNEITGNKINSSRKAIFFGDHTRIIDSSITDNQLSGHHYAFQFDGREFVNNEISDNQYKAEHFYKLSHVHRTVDSVFYHNQLKSTFLHLRLTVLDDDAQALPIPLSNQPLNPLPPPPFAAYTEETFFAIVQEKRLENKAFASMLEFATVKEEGGEQEPQPEAREEPNVEELMATKLSEALSGVDKNEIEDFVMSHEIAKIRTDVETGFRLTHKTEARSGSSLKASIGVGAFVVGIMATVLGVAVYKRGKRATYADI